MVRTALEAALAEMEGPQRCGGRLYIFSDKASSMYRYPVLDYAFTSMDFSMLRMVSIISVAASILRPDALFLLPYMVIRRSSAGDNGFGRALLRTKKKP